MTETFLRDALPVPLMANPGSNVSLSELLVTYEDGVIADLDDLRSTRREAAASIPSGSAAKCRACSFPAGSSA